MTTKRDWDNALDTWVEEERERLGGPPSPEDVVAYLSGELPAAEAARVRALLVYYPELTPLLTERIEQPRVVRKPLALRLYAIAATAVIALLGVNAIEQRRESARPAVVVSQHELNANLTRSGGGRFTYELPAGRERYLITAVPAQPPTETAYTLEIRRDGRVLWSARRVRPVDDTFVLDVPGAFLEPGAYALDVRAGGRLIERYPFRCVTR